MNQAPTSTSIAKAFIDANAPLKKDQESIRGYCRELRKLGVGHWSNAVSCLQDHYRFDKKLLKALIKVVKEEYGEVASPSPGHGRFKPKTFDEVDALPEVEWLIEDFLVVLQLFLLYGPRKAGKTFIALDAGLCIATGKPFFGRPVKQGRVAHIVGEGNLKGVLNRVKAWLRQFAKAERPALLADIKKNWHMIEGPAHIDRPDVREQLIKDLNPGPWDLVFVDTVLRNMAGNVNDVGDAQKFVAACDDIRKKLKTAVALVHHEGKDKSRGSMGSTAIEAAVDGAARVYRDRNNKARRYVEVVLMRDATDDQAKIIFELVPIVLNADAVAAAEFSDGAPVKAIKSAYLKRVEEAAVTVPDQVLLAIFAADGKIGPKAIAAKLTAKGTKISKQAVGKHGKNLMARGDLNADWTLTEQGRKHTSELSAALATDEEAEDDE